VAQGRAGVRVVRLPSCLADVVIARQLTRSLHFAVPQTFEGAGHMGPLTHSNAVAALMADPEVVPREPVFALGPRAAMASVFLRDLERALGLRRASFAASRGWLASRSRESGRLVEPRGIEPLTSSLRTKMRLTFEACSRWHGAAKHLLKRAFANHSRRLTPHF